MLGVVCLLHLFAAPRWSFKGTTRVVRTILLSLGISMPLISLAIMWWLPQLTMPSVAFFYAAVQPHCRRIAVLERQQNPYRAALFALLAIWFGGFM